ncbi:MAG: electron transfer flavoprotein subunit beta/FixA family protein [Bacteroidales bacterium]
MNIVVCIKQVPNTNEIKINPETGTLIREGVPSIMNPDDKSGLELALRLKDEHGAHVTVLTMGPAQADLMLREALAMGADRAILLTDRKFAGADTLATSNALAAALKKIGFDLVIAGRQAIDGDTAQVGPQIAELLDLPQVSYVADCKLNSDNSVNIKKTNETGYQILKAQLPCLLTVLSTGFKPRYMSVSGIMEAYDREVELWTADQVDVSVEKLGLKGSPTKVAKSFAKSVKQAGEQFEVDTEQAVAIIISRLKEKFII